MFTVYNEGNVKIEVIFQSSKPIQQVEENVVKTESCGFFNKTTRIKMDWIAIEKGKQFTFDMKKHKEFKRGNVKVKYQWYCKSIEQVLQHMKGKDMKFTSDYKLDYWSPYNNEPKSRFCSIL